MLRRAAQSLQRLLPPTWGVDLLEAPAWANDDGHDGNLVVRTPAGVTVFNIEVKASEQGTRGAQDAVAQLHSFGSRYPSLLVTSYANPALRKVCEAAGVSYLDETGWVYLRSDDTGLFVTHEGAKRSPSSEKRETTMSRLDGPGASAVIRSLWAARPPVGVRALANHAEVSPGTAAKVLPSLARYGAIERDMTGAVTAVDRRLLLERWVQDYGFLTTNSEVHWFLAPRGPSSAWNDLILPQHIGPNEPRPEVLLAATGYQGVISVLRNAASAVIPNALLSLYASDPELLASWLGLKRASRQTANVVIAKPRDVSLLRPRPAPVPLPQALADLMTMGSRFPELAEQILDMVADTDL